jgi:membrane-associated phospholipid phosphatase
MDAELIDRTTRRYLYAAACAFALLVVTYVVLVRTDWGQRFDDIAFDGREIEDPEITRATNDLLHAVTRTTLLLLTASIVAVALARRRVRLALAAGAAVVASVVTTEFLKLRLLDRPDLDGIAGIEQNSFPSGHATIGMALSLGIVMVAPHRSRWIAAVIAVVTSTAFGVGVLATGWHRPSDSVGAYLVCVIMFCLSTAALLKWRGAGEEEMGTVEERLTPAAAAAAWVGAVAAAAVVLFLTFRESDLRTVELAIDYVLMCLVVIALGAAIVLGYHTSLRGVSLDAPPGEHGADLVTASPTVTELR